MPEPSFPKHGGPLDGLARRLGVDRAVVFAVLLRVWQVLGGAVTAVLILTFFSEQLQGYYYTFASILALQQFFELGFSIVVTNVSSHEWSKLRIDERGEVAGDPDALSRLISLGRLLFVWYALAGLAFIAGVGLAGYWFFSTEDAAVAGIAWEGPWMSVVVLTGLLLWALPFNALLEGCNQVATVNKYRVFQAISASISVWILIAFRGELWALVGAAAARLICDWLLLFARYGRFFQPFWRPPQGPRIDWRMELWPMQWRLAIGGVFGYFAIYLFTPVMFRYHGSDVAGQMGMTWMLVSALQASALAWVQTRAPRMGVLVAERKFVELNRMFRRATTISLAVVVLGGLAAWLGIYALNRADLGVSRRLLEPLPAGLLIAAGIAYHVPHCQAFYIRAHKRETLLLSSVVSSVAIGLLVWRLGSWYGPTGAVAGYLAVVTLITLPFQTYLWRQCRRDFS